MCFSSSTHSDPLALGVPPRRAWHEWTAVSTADIPTPPHPHPQPHRRRSHSPPSPWPVVFPPSRILESRHTHTTTTTPPTTGYYCPGAGVNRNDPKLQDVRIPCPAGRYNDQEHQITLDGCVSCPSGTYVPSVSSSSPVGAVSSTICQACPKGYYCTQDVGELSPTKKACPAGRYSDEVGAGAESLDYSRNCYACSTGTYSPLVASPSYANCRVCAQGKSTDQEGSTTEDECKSCDKGTYAYLTGWGARLCATCEIGFYADEVGMEQCNRCPEGSSTRTAIWTWSPETTAETTQSDDAGGVTTIPETTTYKYVPSYPPSDSSSSCVPCPAGTYATAEQGLNLVGELVEQIKCKACQPGTEAPVSSSNDGCGVCPSNTYADFFEVPAECLASSKNCPFWWGAFGGVTWPNAKIFTLDSYSSQGLPHRIAPMVNDDDVNTVLDKSQGDDDAFYSSIVFSPTRTGVCKPCPAGRYSLPGSAQGQCLACRPGMYGDVVQEPYGFPVDLTYLNGDLDSVRFVGRPSNVLPTAAYNGLPVYVEEQRSGDSLYGNMFGSSKFDCTTCPVGAFSLGGQSTCTACPAGTSKSTMGGTSEDACRTCPEGHVSSSSGASSCTICPAGTYAGYGQQACSPCAAGKYSTIGSATEDWCIECPDGHSSFAGSSSCSICPAGTQAVAGDAVCSPCPYDTFSAPGSSSCRECA